MVHSVKNTSKSTRKLQANTHSCSSHKDAQKPRRCGQHGFSVLPKNIPVVFAPQSAEQAKQPMRSDTLRPYDTSGSCTAVIKFNAC